MEVDYDKHSGDLDNLRAQLDEAQKKAASFRADILRLNEERLTEQQELAVLIEELRDRLKNSLSSKSGISSEESGDANLSSTKLEYLQNTMTQMLSAHIEQEDLTCELGDKLKLATQEIVQLNNAMDKCRQIIEECQLNNPTLFKYSRIPPTDKDPENVVKQLRACIQLLLGHNEVNEIRLKKMEKQWSSSVAEHQKEIEELKEAHLNRLQEQRNQFNVEMANAIKRAEAATVEARDLSLQATNIRSSLEEQIQCKTEEVLKLKEELQAVTGQMQNNKQTECEDVLRSALDKAEQEAIKLRCERDTINIQSSVLRTKLEAAEAHMKEMDNKFAQINAMNQLLKQKYSKMKREYSKIQTERVTVYQAIEKLMNMMSNQMDWKESFIMPTTGSDDWVRNITDKLTCLTETIRKATHTCKDAKNNPDCRKQEREGLVATIAQLKVDLDKKEQMIDKNKQILDQQQADLERVMAERDYYMQVLTEQGEELCTVKAKYRRQLKEIDKLKRAKARLDELTSQVQLLKMTPLRCESVQENQRQYTTRLQISNQPLSTDSWAKQPLESNGDSCDSTMKLKKASHCNRSINNGFEESNTMDLTVKEYVDKDAISKPVSERWLKFVTKLNGLNKAHTLLQVAKNDIEMARNSVGPLQTTDTGNVPESTQTSSVNALKRRLNQLEVQMIRAANEKQDMTERNRQMSGLLCRLTEQNRKLLKEIEEHSGSHVTQQEIRNPASQIPGLTSRKDIPEDTCKPSLAVSDENQTCGTTKFGPKSQASPSPSEHSHEHNLFTTEIGIKSNSQPPDDLNENALWNSHRASLMHNGNNTISGLSCGETEYKTDFRGSQQERGYTTRTMYQDYHTVSTNYRQHLHFDYQKAVIKDEQNDCEDYSLIKYKSSKMCDEVVLNNRNHIQYEQSAWNAFRTRNQQPTDLSHNSIEGPNKLATNSINSITEERFTAGEPSFGLPASY